MLTKEAGLEKDLKRQKKTLRKKKSFTPYLKWAPTDHTTYKRTKGSDFTFTFSSSSNNSRNITYEPKIFNATSAEIASYTKIIKQQMARGRNFMRQCKTVSIERISEKGEEEEAGLESARSYKKDTATTSSSSGKRVEGDQWRETEGVEGLVKAYKESIYSN